MIGEYKYTFLYKNCVNLSYDIFTYHPAKKKIYYKLKPIQKRKLHNKPKYKH